MHTCPHERTQARTRARAHTHSAAMQKKEDHNNELKQKECLRKSSNRNQLH